MIKHKRILLDKYFAELISRLNSANRFSTSRNYARTISSVMDFLSGRSLYMDELTADVVAQYNRFLLDKDLQRNTISFYNRVLRSVYNQAVKEGYARQTFPFAEVYTGVDVTRKRALSVETLHRIATLSLDDPDLALARDLFLFSFQARGMCFVDMAFLTHKNLQAGFIQYVRRKTGQAISVRVEPWMQAILDRYRKSCREPYLLPILQTSEPKEAFAQYTLALSRHNRMLRRLGEMVGTETPLTSYSARHSWATIARDTAIPLSVISTGMGHTSERTTRIYLASLDNSLVDRANREVWERVNNAESQNKERKR